MLAFEFSLWRGLKWKLLILRSQITRFWTAGDGDGELTLLEMASMLRDMKLSNVTNADILYFMVRHCFGACVHVCVGKLPIDLSQISMVVSDLSWHH